MGVLGRTASGPLRRPSNPSRIPPDPVRRTRDPPGGGHFPSTSMTPIDSNTLEFLEGLASFDVVFLKLARNDKHSLRNWEHYIDLHEQRGSSRIDLAAEWLQQGFGLGFLPRNRLWVVDLDRQKGSTLLPMQDRLEDFQAETLRFGPRVETPSGGLHAYLRLPDDLDLSRLKHHICHPEEDEGVRLEWDFKMGHRTLLVAPGTVQERANGTRGQYTPATPWFEPSVCDPRWLMPSLSILRPASEPFLTDPREEKDRIVRAVTFLQKKAPVSVLHSGGLGYKALWKVAVHLVAYLRLDPLLAVHLMTHPVGTSWNARCRDTSGNPAPWSFSELQAACYAAQDEVPPYGVVEYQQQQARNRVVSRLADFMHILTFLPFSEERMLASDLYRLFLEVEELEEDECSQKRFGDAMRTTMQEGILSLDRSRWTKARLWGYVGVSEPLVLQAIQDREQLQPWLKDVA